MTTGEAQARIAVPRKSCVDVNDNGQSRFPDGGFAREKYLAPVVGSDALRAPRGFAARVTALRTFRRRSGSFRNRIEPCFDTPFPSEYGEKC
jgi:hypothetical protein